MKSGVYQIINTINSNQYIGSSVNLKRRKNEHFNLLRKNKHNNKHLQNSYNKYGEENFLFVILEICEKIKCVEIEQIHINKHKPIFNINPTAGNSLGIKHSNETIEKIRNSKIGKKKTEETKEKIRNSINKLIKEKGCWGGAGGGVRTEKQKEFMRTHPSTVKKSKPIQQLSLENKPIKKWKSTHEIQRELGYYPIHISRCCNGLRKTSYGYKWEYIK